MKLTSLSLRLLTAQKILMKGPDSWKFSKIPCFFYSICFNNESSLSTHSTPFALSHVFYFMCMGKPNQYYL